MQAPSRLKDGKGGGGPRRRRQTPVSERAFGPSDQGGGKAARVSLNPLKTIGRVGVGSVVEIPGGKVAPWGEEAGVWA